MDSERLARQFHRIGARVKIQESRWGPDLVIDIRRVGREEGFLLTVRADSVDALDLSAVDVQPERRHLLLLAKRRDGAGGDEKRKFLCGHDERHWFVAAVPGAASVSSVETAMEALKPVAARVAQRQRRVRRKDWHRRSNRGFVRQGEWFFLPRPDFEPPDPAFVLRGEPLQRPGGTPHVVEELYRDGGTAVYVHPRYPRGLTEPQHARLLARRPEARRWNWEVMRRNPAVYARGKVRHPDHATIELICWHMVVISEEQRTGNVGFLD